jgi:hypothetical protein
MTRAAPIREQDGYVHCIHVTRGGHCPLRASGKSQHTGIARHDLGDKSAYPAAHCVFLETRLQRGSKTRSLKLRRNHEGHLGKIGRRAQELAGAAYDLLVLALASDG